LKISSSRPESGHSASLSLLYAFNNVIKQADNLFIEQSQWNIGLCYLGRNENEKAIKQFRRIVEQQGYYQKQAEKLLKKLE
jgi:hypothetical protein